jgi:hypothetical protein
MEKRMRMKGEMLWRRKAAETSRWRVATQPLKIAPNPMASMTLFVYPGEADPVIGMKEIQAH